MDKYPKKTFKPFSFQTNLPSFLLPKDTSISSLEVYKSNFERVVSAFLEWLRFTERRVLVFKRVSRSKCKITADDVLVMPWSHRWDRFYMKKLKKRYFWAMEWFLDRNFIHLDITARRSENIAVYMRELKKAWKLLRDYLVWNKSVKVKGRVVRRFRFDYVTVLEPHKSGFPHLHAMIFTDAYLIDQDKLSKYLESKGVGKVCYIKRYWAYRYGKRPIFYLAKYLSKYWQRESWNDAFLVFSAFLWATGTRTISASRGFFGGLDRGGKEKEWELWFTCDFEEVVEILSQANIDTDKVALPLYCCLGFG